MLGACRKWATNRFQVIGDAESVGAENALDLD